MLITNSHIIIDQNSKWYDSIFNYFVKIENDEVKQMYTLDNNRDIRIDKGLKFLLPKNLISECRDITTNEIKIDIDNNPESYRNILNGITLRDDQVLTVMKALYHKRGIIQIGTGGGKTICIAAILKYYFLKLGYYPDTIIFEPTNRLVEDMIERFNSYGIPVSRYSDNRGSISGIVISHPKSLYNDLKNNPEIFSSVKIFISDEAHHLGCETWHTISSSLSNVEVALGFSASVISDNKIPITDISSLSFDESVIIGSLGNIIINIPASKLIKQGVLATPVLIRLINPAIESVKDKRDWHELRKNRLESDHRSDLICHVASFFSRLSYKVLILTNTKTHAKKLSGILRAYHTQDKVICSFGGGEYLKVVNDTLVNCDSDSDPKSDFDKGLFNIMIGTTHLYEGVDIPNLDVVILASVGKQPRKLIQGVGRSLRISKTGNYAYIIDFNDFADQILSRHSDMRMGMYKEIIGVQSSNIYDNCSLDYFESTIKRLEDIK